MLGGLLVEWNPFDLGWRVLFLINLPVGGIALTIAARTLPEARVSHPPSLDWGGVALATAALAALIVPLIEGHQAGWPPWAIALLVLSVPLIAWFVLAERRSARSGHDPVIDMELFRLVSFRRGLAMIVAYFFGGGSLFLVLSLYEQKGLGLDTLHAALTFTSFAIGLFVASIAATRYAAHYRSQFLHVGFALVCVGIGLLVVGFARARDGDARGAIELGLAIYGLGQGCAMPVMFSSVISQVPLKSAGAASGVLATCQQVSAAVGVAVIGLVFSTVLAQRAGPIPHAEAATWALCLNLGSMVLSAVLAWRLPSLPSVTGTSDTAATTPESHS
jgi:predicted MFS family arabinose efflux permease